MDSQENIQLGFHIDEKYVLTDPKLKWWFCAIKIHKCNMGISSHFLIVMRFVKKYGMRDTLFIQVLGYFGLQKTYLVIGELFGDASPINPIFFFLKGCLRICTSVNCLVVFFLFSMDFFPICISGITLNQIHTRNRVNINIKCKP